VSTEPSIVKRADGVYVDPATAGTILVAAVDDIFRAGNLLAGLDYPALLHMLFGYAPAGAAAAHTDGAPVRIATAVQPFDPVRRALYRPLKIAAGRAEYTFEPVWLPDPADADAQGAPTRLEVDEFVADAWLKGIRFGIDVDAVRAAIAAARSERVTVAMRVEPAAGADARIVEVSDDIHRSNAPRQLANGRLDLHSFQNRFPQIQPGIRLLQKIPLGAGSPGVEMSGAAMAATPGADVDLGTYAGPGTKVERMRDGEFLVSQRAGFLAVDAKTSQMSIEDKIVSRDGVSGRTTGNLELTGDYEEFGEVQENRVVDGEGITVHGDVFGRLASRGGTILLHANLVGGSAHNERGDIHVRGVASKALIQATNGAIVLERAENCVIAGTRITVAHALNCEIVGDDVTVERAEGCAIAGRRVTVAASLPRKQGEMLVYVLQPEGPPVAELIAAVAERVAQFGELAARHKEAMAQLTGRSDLRRYLMLAARVRKKDIVLSPEQLRQFQRMAQEAAPALKEVADASAKAKAAEAEQQKGAAMLAGLEAQRLTAACVAQAEVKAVQGETQVRVLGFSPVAGSPYLMAPRDIQARLRGPQRGAVLFAGDTGRFLWNSELAAETI
jgi:hypothetical protein